MLGKSLAIFHQDSETLAAACRKFSVKWGGKSVDTTWRVSPMFWLPCWELSLHCLQFHNNAMRWKLGSRHSWSKHIWLPQGHVIRKWCSQEAVNACGWRPGGARTGLPLRAFRGSLALPTPWFWRPEPWKQRFLLSEANQFAVVGYRSQRKLT